MNAALLPRVSLSPAELHHTPQLREMAQRAMGIGMNVSMLARDLGNMHYGYSTNLEFGDTRREGAELICGLLSEMSEYEQVEPEEPFYELVSTVARDHLVHGRCVFELFDAREDDDSPLLPRLGVLPGWSLRSRRGISYQIAPAGTEVVWRALPAASLVEFRLPDRLGRILRRTGERLRALDAFKAIDLDEFPAGYDFTVHQRMLDEMAVKATASIGWSHLSGLMSRATSNFQVYRRLQLVRTWIVIVSAVAETVNCVIAAPCVHGRSPCSFRVAGLPSLERVDAAMVAVTTGDQTLDEISRSVLRTMRPA
ncbi:hypothetical protein ABZX92_40935 [Lentzea sp. NPDC006480]|uniref:hypothetical protein n=1 Tax=Lentzea sp. NPDC006480 TaxID=3157176 RepID=UPI0033B814C6